MGVVAMRLTLLPIVLAVSCLAVDSTVSVPPSSVAESSRSDGAPADPVIEAIEVEGLYRMTRPAFLHALGVELGDPYDLRDLRSRHESLWSTKIFEDIDFEARPAACGNRILVYQVREAPATRSVTIDEVAGVTSETVLSRLAELGLRFKIGMPPDLRSLPLAEQAVRDILSERGYPGAIVVSEVTHPVDSMVSIHFGVTIDPSPLAGSTTTGSRD